MAASSDEKLTKVYVSLGVRGGETMWANEVEGDLFAIRNLPFFAFGLNFGDIVVAPDIGGVRHVQRVVRRSGHRTVRIVFSADLQREEQQVYLHELRTHGATFERATDRMVAVDASPEADYEAILAPLYRGEATGALAFETCEERVPGRFEDDARESSAA
jgi:Domain of unknown function (DUF4265)